MSRFPNFSRPCALACCLAAAGVQAQVLVKPPIGVPVLAAKYYVARDLGRIAEGKPVGCLARNGALAVSRYRYESATNRWLSRAVIPGGNPEFAFFYIEGYESWVSGCNSRGEYVGVSAGHGGGVIWDSDWWSGPQRLGSNALGPNAPAAINDARQVVGTTANSWPTFAGARWETSQLPNDARTTLRLLAPGGATAINGTGAVAMTQWMPGQPSRAMVYAPDLVTVTYVPIQGATQSWANGIDDQSRVVGASEDAGGQRRGYLWHAVEGFVPLQPANLGLAPLSHAEARAIGLDRTVVGQSYNVAAGQPTQHAATVWIQAGTARNLNRESQTSDSSALPALTDAVAVSDSGAILCDARTATGERHAVLLTPNPGGRWNLFP
jgi:hypothetical protein